MEHDEASTREDAKKTNSIELSSGTRRHSELTPLADTSSLTLTQADLLAHSGDSQPVNTEANDDQHFFHEDTDASNNKYDKNDDENDTLSPFLDHSTVHGSHDRRPRGRNSGYLAVPDDDSNNNNRRSIPRSRSVISLRAINDSVDRIVKDIRDKFQQYRAGRRSRLLQDIPHLNQIYYSVFKSLPSLSTFHMPREGCTATGPISQSQFDAIVDSVVDAIDAGVAPKLISQGSSGSYFMYDANGKIVGVFKPKDEEPYGPLSPKWTKWLHRNLFPCFFGRPCLVPNNGYICESAASLLDRQLLTHIIPFTDIVYLSSSSFYYRFFDRRRFNKGRPLPNKVGSFQLFLHEYEQADVFLKKHPLPSSSRPAPVVPNTNSDEPVFAWTPDVLQQFREELEKLVILDYIMRNTDRGLDNWMIKVEWKTVPDDNLIDTSNSGSPQMKKVPHLKIGAIDSGLAFPWKHPDEWRSYPFGWLFLPLSIIGQPFSKSTRDHFLPMLCSQEWWEESTIVFRHLFSQDSEFQERLWKRQWAVMKGQAFNVVETLKCVEQGPLELVRRTRIMVWDDEMDVPVHVPYANMSNAMETPMWQPPSTYRDNESVASYHDYENEEEQQFPEYPAQSSRQKQSNSTGEDASARMARALSIENRLTVPKRGRRARGSSLSLEAKYRALEGSESGSVGSGHGSSNMFDELISDAQPSIYPDTHNEPQQNREGEQVESHKKGLVNNVGFSIAEGSQASQASQRVIVERLQTVTSKPPVFTWC